MGEEGPLLFCGNNDHLKIRDYGIGEECCSACGLVLSDELRIEYEVPLERLWRPYISRKNFRRPRSTILPRSKVETCLEGLLKNRNASVLVKKKAFEICRSQKVRSLLERESPEVGAEALTYVANRLCHVPQALSAVRTDSSRHANRVLRCCQQILSRLEIEFPRLKDQDYLTYLATRMRIDEEIGRGAMQTLSMARQKHVLGGTNPMGTVATAVYTASKAAGKKVTQRQMARVAAVSESTIRANHRILKLITRNMASQKR